MTNAGRMRRRLRRKRKEGIRFCMRPKELTLCGWGPYKSTEKVDFTVFEKRGIFLITGATGSGKTTIFDAISYALYGALSGDERDKERSSVRSDFADGETPTYVELVMEHGGKTYRIHRNPEYLRPKKRNAGQQGFTKEKENAVLTFPDGRVLEGVREVNAALKELLVLDYQQFKKISMIAQGEFARLLVAPPKDKTRIFREIFDTGIMERFTQALGVRARASYALVAEQKHKLEEDVKVLTAGLEKSGWSDGLREELRELAEAENPNYDALTLCLGRMEAEAHERALESRKAFAEADKRTERLLKELTSLEEENKRILQLVQAEKEFLDVQAKKQTYERKQEVYSKAMNAGWVEGAEEKKRQQERQLMQNQDELERVLAGQLAEAEELLKQEQKAYLRQERLCSEAREAYEAAEHRRKLHTIGLAAELLEEGKPCPVCGSVQHPAPAGISGDFISEEAVKKLKQQAEKQNKELTRIHGQAVTQKTRLDGMLERREQLVRKGELLKEQLKEAEDIFWEALRQYGFEDEESYRRAKLSKADREELQRELDAYRARAAAAEELYCRLKESVRGSEPVELSKQRAELAESRDIRDAAMKEQRLWEQHAAEVKKTRQLISGKLDKIERESIEYGYVKDLENLATGNNPRRLVFEQYVLAGYFEEILRAANLRLSGMTGGRYEMSRVQQVGDGRVKDNLEIQVMDYYTGKYRSVRTLSGGEAFKASLALALGMSDVIQAMNGGIRVDTLFVDEGFGALDEESLEQACDTLMKLAEKQQLIGIISHVPELRERIAGQLVIEKTGGGSRIKSCG